VVEELSEDDQEQRQPLVGDVLVRVEGGADLGSIL
jgi:hypothetical protein